jgi:hypothetical protein
MGFRDIEQILKVPTKDKTYCFQQLFKDIKKLAMGILPVHVEATWKTWMYYQKVYPVIKRKKDI